MLIEGKRVIDAKRGLNVRITSRDVNLGRSKDPESCAAARAIIRAYRKDGAKKAKVHVGRVYIEYRDHWIRYKTPNTLRAEIISFDRGSSPKFMEGSYKLLPISGSDRLGAGRRNKPSGPKSRKAPTTLHRVLGARARAAGHKWG